MDNKMIEVKDSFWKKIKNFFVNIVPKRKNVNVSIQDEQLFNEVKEKHNANEEIEEEKIDALNKTIEREFENDSQVDYNRESHDTKTAKEYEDVVIDGKKIRCYETIEGEDYTKRYLSIGEKEAKYTKRNGVEKKSFVVYGYREYSHNTRGMSFTEKVKDKNLDKVLTKTTNDDITEIVQVVPLIDAETETCKGKYERREVNYSNGDRKIEENKQIIDDVGNQHSIIETYSHSQGKFIHTKYLNGNVCFQMTKDSKGTLIKEYDNKGNIINTYQYDKEGNPTEKVEFIGEDGRIRRRPKTYMGIEAIPTDSISFEELCKSKEHEKFDLAIIRAAIPENIQSILDNVYMDTIKQSDIKDLEKAKDKFKSKGQNNQMERPDNFSDIDF